jgi:hypothetical protein
MAVAIRTITRLQDADDVNVTLGAGVDEYALSWDNDTAKFVLRAVAAGVTDHGALTGLTPDDDHTQYALLAGRTGGQTLYGGDAANDDITIHGTSNATRTTSYVLLQPTNGNVGIATTSPTGGKLHITLPASDATALYIEGGNPARMGFASNGFIGISGVANFIQMFATGAMMLSSKAGSNINLIPGSGGVVVLGGASLTVPSLVINAAGANYIQFNEFGVAQRWQIGNAAGSSTFQFSSGAELGTDTRFSLTTHGIMALAAVTAATNAVTNVLTVGHDTSGTAANGFGAGQLFQLESSTTAAQAAARIQALWYEATHATRKADLVLTAYDTAEREGLRIRGAGSAAAIGFYGVTPIARATLATGAGASVDDVITALQNLGLVKQS